MWCQVVPFQLKANKPNRSVATSEVQTAAQEAAKALEKANAQLKKEAKHSEHWEAPAAKKKVPVVQH